MFRLHAVFAPCGSWTHCPWECPVEGMPSPLWQHWCLQRYCVWMVCFKLPNECLTQSRAINSFSTIFVTAKHLLWAAFLFGLSVHVKIYPITYALPIALSLRATEDASKGCTKTSKWRSFAAFTGSFLNRELLLFAGVSAAVFSVLTALFYYM